MQKTFNTSTWGYNPWGTNVVTKNSPGWYLRQLYLSQTSEGTVPGYIDQFYNVFKRWATEAWGYNPWGTNVIVSGSPGWYLENIYKSLTYEGTIPGYIDQFYKVFKNRSDTRDNLLLSLGRSVHTFDSSEGAVTYNATEGIYRLWLPLSQIPGRIDNFYNLARSLGLSVHTFDVGEGAVTYNATEGIYRLWLILNLIPSRIDNFYDLVKDYWRSDNSLISSGFSDVLDKLDSLSVSVEVDFSGVESRLDSIIRLLTVAGVVENAKDVLDAIFGDMGFDATEAASAAVGSAIQSAFPFCVPAVLKQILGLLQADPAPPEFHFDFWGAPLDFGFSDWQGLADMTSWLSRIGFAVVLFANSRRFVYSGGVAGD